MTFRKIWSAALLAAALAAPLQGYSAAYARIGGITGETRDIVHKHWVEITSLSQGPYRWTQKDASLALLPDHSFSEDQGEVTITRRARKAIPDIYTACVNGTYFGTASFDIPVRDGNDTKYIRLTLSDAVVTEFNLHRPDVKHGIPIEQITLHYEHARWDRPALKSDGKPNGSQKLRSLFRKQNP